MTRFPADFDAPPAAEQSPSTVLPGPGADGMMPGAIAGLGADTEELGVKFEQMHDMIEGPAISMPYFDALEGSLDGGMEPQDIPMVS